MSLWLKRLGIACTSLLMALVLGEVVARLAEPGPFSLYDRKPYMPHDTLAHVHRPGFEGRWDGTWYGIDSRGYRGPEFSSRPTPEEYRVVAVGDSCTFGKGVRERETWPRQLQHLLAGVLPGGQAVVVNLGVNGYSGRDYRARVLDGGLELHPDLVVVGYNLNDFPNVIRAVDRKLYAETQGLRDRIPKGVRDGLGRLALFRWLRSQYYALGRDRAYAQAEGIAADVGGEGDEEVWRLQAGYLEDIAEACRETGVELAVFLFPYESQVYLDRFETRPIDRLSGICADLDVTFVDLAETLREYVRRTSPTPTLFLRGDRYHLNAKGYELVARAVLAVIQERGWMKPD